jgi:hypothetical protein
MVWCCKNIHLSTIFYYTIFELVELTSLRCSSSCLLGSLSLWNTISFFIKI